MVERCLGSILVPNGRSIDATTTASGGWRGIRWRSGARLYPSVGYPCRAEREHQRQYDQIWVLVFQSSFFSSSPAEIQSCFSTK